jgi:PTH1 family peptidyl-tRNA hydrolase
MKLIVGLGNPGPKYRDTRHNVGFRAIDEVARRVGVTFESAPAEAVIAKVRQPEPLLLAKPLTFMNSSGQAVGDLQRYFKIDLADLLVVVDDVNLPLGRLRVRRGGSAGGHNGLKSVEAAFGSDEYPRLRIGVGRGDARRDLADHVLARFDPDEREAVDETVARAADAIETFITADLDTVMNRYNRADDLANG